MSLTFKIDWQAAGQDARPESALTTGRLEAEVDGVCLTEVEGASLVAALLDAQECESAVRFLGTRGRR